MNANELVEDLEGAKLVILRLNNILRQQQAEIEALKNNMNTATNELLQKQDEIEALKAKLKQYHLKEDLDRNLNLIYGKEFIK